MNKISVLQVNKLYYPHIGGIESTVKELSEGLNDKVNISVLVCQKKGFRTVYEIVNGVKVIRTQSLGFALGMPLSLTFPLVFKNLAFKYDIIHLHYPFPIGELSYLLSKCKAKLIVTWHSDIVRQSWLLKAYEPIFSLILDKAEAILVETPNMITGSSYLNKYYQKCKVVPVGIDRQKYRKSKEIIEGSKAFRKQNGHRILLFVGRLVYYKGVGYLIDAMKTVDAKLFIVGDGPLKSELMEKVRVNGLEEKVYFLPHLPENDLITLYHSCDIFVFPSAEKTETFGRVQVEAMLCGKPVINTWLPTGVPYVSVDGITGLTVPPKCSSALAEAINNLLEDNEKRREMGLAAKMRAENIFSIEAMLDKTYKIYQEVICK